MPKFGAGLAELAGGIALGAIPGGAALAPYLISAGAGSLISGVGSLLAQNGVKAISTAERNPIKPWNYVYGKKRVGGTLVYLNTWPKDPGGNWFLDAITLGLAGSPGQVNQVLDMVFVVAAHPCESVDSVLFDMQRIQIDTTARVNTHQVGSGAMNAGPAATAGTSFTPVQNHLNISQIQRSNGVVTVTLSWNIPLLQEGDMISVAEDGPGLLTDNNLIGTFPVEQIISQTFGDPGSITFTYLSGGTNVTITGHGHVNTLWADYGKTVYFEPMLGGQSLGQSFNGMVFGTPKLGDLGNVITPQHPSDLGAVSPNPWTSDCSLMGKTAVFLRLIYNKQYYKGIPQISFLVRGKNNVYDPRTSPPTAGYTANAALCVADYLNTPRKYGGFGMEYGSQIPTAQLIAAANVCDEQVPLAYSLASPPLTENAYESNGEFTLEHTRGEILRNMLTACGGRVVFSGGQAFIYPASWAGNSYAIGANPGAGVIALGNLTEIAAGPVKWNPSRPARDLYNGVKGTFISKANKWQATDFPPYCQDALHGYSGPSPSEGDANLAADGGERRWLDIQLPFTTSYSCAQRLAKIELLRRRTAAVSRTRGTGTLVLNMTAYQMAVLDLVQLTWALLQFSAKQLEITDMRLRIVEAGQDEGPSLAVEVDLIEADATIYDWSTTEELSPAGFPQPVIPGLTSISFFAGQPAPGYDVPYPWSPAYSVPLVGDAVYPGPYTGSPPVSQAKASFGLQVVYNGPDAQGSPAMTLEVQGVDPPNQLSSLDPPQISCAVGTSGNLPAGTYLVSASVLDSNGNNTRIATPVPVTIPVSSPPVSNGSITVTITYPSNDPSGSPTVTDLEIYMGQNMYGNGLPVAGFCRQGGLQSSLPATYTITDFDQSQPGAPDNLADHYGVAWKKVIHSGVWAQQIQALTSDTITIAGSGMTLNQWSGYVLTLLGKLDSTQELIVLNMPVSASTASATQTINGVTTDYFTLTVGPNSAGQQLPDLTTLMIVGDLVVMRGKYTFTADSFEDDNVANSYYPQGATAVEGGHVAVVLTGADAGDVQTIQSVATGSGGQLTKFLLAGTWLTTPSPGDIVLVTEAPWGPEVHTHPFAAKKTGAVSGIIAAPAIQNLGGETWLAIVRMQNIEDVNGSDQYAPMRDFYVFGSQGTREIQKTQSMLPADSVLPCDATNGNVVLTCLPFVTVPNQKYWIQKIDSSANTVTVQTYATPDPGYYAEVNYSGALFIGTGLASLTLPFGGTTSACYAKIFAPSVGSGITIKVNRNGTLWATLTFNAGDYVSNTVTGLGSLSTSDVMSIDCSGIGSTNPGTNVTVEIQFSGGGQDTIPDGNGVAQTSIVLKRQWDTLEFVVPQ